MLNLTYIHYPNCQCTSHLLQIISSSGRLEGNPLGEVGSIRVILG